MSVELVISGSSTSDALTNSTRKSRKDIAATKVLKGLENPITRKLICRGTIVRGDQTKVLREPSLEKTTSGACTQRIELKGDRQDR